jgi:hypothetical protein
MIATILSAIKLIQPTTETILKLNLVNHAGIEFKRRIVYKINQGQECWSCSKAHSLFPSFAHITVLENDGVLIPNT